ncbi:MAG: glycosyltransferase family 9 protein [Candidatus Eisenbacteria bacterium]|nr:glycosyltransferase family 9 protein [Candidatus Eisenbacteria bacterium]
MPAKKRRKDSEARRAAPGRAPAPEQTEEGHGASSQDVESNLTMDAPDRDADGESDRGQNRPDVTDVGASTDRQAEESDDTRARPGSREPSRLGRMIAWYLTRFRRQEPISFGEAFRSIERILVIPERGVSGALFSMPTLKALRRGFPNGKIAVLVHEDDKDLLEGAGEVDRVIGYELPGGIKRFSALLSLGHRIGSYGFDIAIVLDREFDAERAFLCYLSRALVRGGIQPDGSQPFYNLEVSRSVPAKTRAQLGIEIARVMGVNVEGLSLTWEVPERERKLAEQLVHFRKPREDELLVGFDPGPGRGGTSLSVSQQAKLLDKLCTDYHARAILLTAPEHHWLVAKLESMLNREPIVVQQRRMRDVVSLLGQCDLFVAGNTDLVYFAVAMGIPTVSLMTPAEMRSAAFPDSGHLEIVELKPGERFPIHEFIERTQAVLLSASG